MNKRRQDITRRFRKVSWGRLYWKANDRGRTRNRFDSDDLCIVTDGVAVIHYKSIEALLDDIEHFESTAEHESLGGV